MIDTIQYFQPIDTYNDKYKEVLILGVNRVIRMKIRLIDAYKYIYRQRSFDSWLLNRAVRMKVKIRLTDAYNDIDTKKF